MALSEWASHGGNPSFEDFDGETSRLIDKLNGGTNSDAICDLLRSLAFKTRTLNERLETSEAGLAAAQAAITALDDRLAAVELAIP